MRNATTEDCPCCHERISPGVDTDRAFVAAFIGGVLARDHNIPLAAALCRKHAALCADALHFVVTMDRSS